MVTSCVARPAVDTVTADPDLLALEFEAIVAASYPPSGDRPALRPPLVRCATATGCASGGCGGPTSSPGSRWTRADRRRRRARQRSPPA